jgi:hypothetical protein
LLLPLPLLLPPLLLQPSPLLLLTNNKNVLCASHIYLMCQLCLMIHHLWRRKEEGGAHASFMSHITSWVAGGWVGGPTNAPQQQRVATREALGCQRRRRAAAAARAACCVAGKGPDFEVDDELEEKTSLEKARGGLAVMRAHHGVLYVHTSMAWQGVEPRGASGGPGLVFFTEEEREGGWGVLSSSSSQDLTNVYPPGVPRLKSFKNTIQLCEPSSQRLEPTIEKICFAIRDKYLVPTKGESPVTIKY